MSFQSLIAHSGHSHQKSSSAEKPNQSTSQAQPDLKSGQTDFPSLTPESNPTSEKQVLQVPQTNTKTETDTESLTIKETTTPSELETATLVPGFGESIFTLLIASPFMLLGFKKWLHK